MAESDLHKRAAASGPRLSPDEIAARGFATAFRGLSEPEVRSFLKRVSEDVTRAIARERELTERVAALEAQIAHPEPPTEQQLLDALGEETARVLISAQTAATEIRTKAQALATDLTREAQDEARTVRENSQQEAAARAEESERRRAELEEIGERKARDVRDAADRDAAEVRSRAERESDEMRATTKAESDAATASARHESASLIEEARALREKVLTDMARHRTLLQAQIDELRAGRDRLLDAYRVVKRTLGDATEALAGVEARAAQERTSDEALPVPPIDGVDEAVFAAVGQEHAGVSGSETSPQAPTPAGEPGASAVADAPVTAAPVPVPTTGPPGTAAPVPVPTARPPADTPAVAKTAGGSDSDVGSATPSSPIATPPPDVKADPGKGADVDALFAQLRAAQDVPLPDSGGESAPSADAGAEAAPSRATGKDPEPSPDPAARSAATPASTPPSRDDRLRTRRDDALASIRRDLLRAAKRALQDDQNALLDRLRTSKGRPSPAVLPERDVQHTAWVAVVKGPVGEAYRSARRSVRRGPMPKVPEDLVRALAASIVDPLRDRLVAALDDAGLPGAGVSDDADDLTERLSARFREFRAQRLDDSVDDALCAAWARGVFDAAPPGARLRWIPERVGRCPDCDDNALESAVKGQNFPTGQGYPPAHSGCRCLVDVEERAATGGPASPARPSTAQVGA